MPKVKRIVMGSKDELREGSVNLFPVNWRKQALCGGTPLEAVQAAALWFCCYRCSWRSSGWALVTGQPPGGEDV